MLLDRRQSLAMMMLAAASRFLEASEIPMADAKTYAAVAMQLAARSVERLTTREA